MKPQDRTRAIRNSTLDAMSALVAVMVCDSMDRTDATFVSIPTLAKYTRLSERTVSDVLTAGIAAGWLDARGTPGCKRWLRVRWERLNDERKDRTAGVAKVATHAPGAPVTPAPGSMNPCAGLHEPLRRAQPTPAPGAPEAVYEAVYEAVSEAPPPPAAPSALESAPVPGATGAATSPPPPTPSESPSPSKSQRPPEAPPTVDLDGDLRAYFDPDPQAAKLARLLVEQVGIETPRQLLTWDVDRLRGESGVGRSRALRIADIVARRGHRFGGVAEPAKPGASVENDAPWLKLCELVGARTILPDGPMLDALRRVGGSARVRARDGFTERTIRNEFLTAYTAAVQQAAK